jgi:hypothetical protein
VNRYQPTRVGDSVSGRVTQVGSAASEYTRDTFPVVTLVDADGCAWEVPGFHWHLRTQVRGIEVGDRISVAYKGKRNHSSGRYSYHVYTVEISTQYIVESRSITTSRPAPAATPDP